jgi:hypothetical protein
MSWRYHDSFGHPIGMTSTTTNRCSICGALQVCFCFRSAEYVDLGPPFDQVKYTRCGPSRPASSIRDSRPTQAVLTPSSQSRAVRRSPPAAARRSTAAAMLTTAAARARRLLACPAASSLPGIVSGASSWCASGADGVLLPRPLDGVRNKGFSSSTPAFQSPG